MPYLDERINLILTHMGRRADALTREFLVEDLRLCHDSARVREAEEGEEIYRSRCNRLLVAANLGRKWAKGKTLEYLDALEGVLLGVMRGDSKGKRR